MIEPITFTIFLFSLISMSIIGISVQKIKRIEKPITDLRRKTDLDLADLLVSNRALSRKKIDEIHNKTAVVTSSMAMHVPSIGISPVGDPRVKL